MFMLLIYCLEKVRFSCSMNGTHREVVPKEAMMENMYVISRHGHPVMVDQSGMPEHVITLSDLVTV